MLKYYLEVSFKQLKSDEQKQTDNIVSLIEKYENDKDMYVTFRDSDDLIIHSYDGPMNAKGIKSHSWMSALYAYPVDILSMNIWRSSRPKYGQIRPAKDFRQLDQDGKLAGTAANIKHLIPVAGKKKWMVFFKISNDFGVWSANTLFTPPEFNALYKQAFKESKNSTEWRDNFIKITLAKKPNVAKHGGIKGILRTGGLFHNSPIERDQAVFFDIDILQKVEAIQIG